MIRYNNFSRKFGHDVMYADMALITAVGCWSPYVAAGLMAGTFGALIVGEEVCDWILTAQRVSLRRGARIACGVQLTCLAAGAFGGLVWQDQEAQAPQRRLAREMIRQTDAATAPYILNSSPR